MSDTPVSKTRGKAGLIVAIVAAVVYVATWPLVEIEATRFHQDLQLRRDFSVRTVGVKKLLTELDPGPAWLETFYYPLQVLREVRNGDNAAAKYWKWWNLHLLKMRTQAFREKVRERLRA